MDTRFEAEAMRLFERALEQPAPLRASWLQRQDAAPEIAARVGDLLAKEAALTSCLEQPAGAGRTAASTLRLPGVGDRVGAWRLLRELDAGGMGVVFVAARDDGAYEQRAAVKFVRTDHLLDARRRDEIV